jgi:signal transduction histidine kinase
MIKDLASGAMEEVRLLSYTVYPRVLDDLGLPAAIRTLAREASARSNGVAIEPDVDARLEKLPPAVSAALYRVAQEAVSNALRHGSPELIRILGTADDRTARLEITDDGSGFDLAEAEQRRPGMGIFAMRERVSLVDGNIDIMSEPAGGTHIVVTVPLQASPFTRTSEA